MGAISTYGERSDNACLATKRLHRVDSEPSIPHIGFALIVAGAIGELDRREAAMLVEPSCKVIALEGPQAQLAGTQFHGLRQQGAAGALSLHAGTHVKIVQLGSVEGDVTSESPVRFGHPDILVRQHDGGDPFARLVVAVHHREPGHRLTPSAEVNLCYRIGIFGAGWSELNCHGVLPDYQDVRYSRVGNESGMSVGRM